MTDSELVAQYLSRGGKVTKIASQPVEAAAVSKLRQTVGKPSRKTVKRNWSAQAKYDAEHGTVSGYDPEIEARRREWAYEFGD